MHDIRPGDLVDVYRGDTKIGQHPVERVTKRFIFVHGVKYRRAATAGTANYYLGRLTRVGVQPALGEVAHGRRRIVPVGHDDHRIAKARAAKALRGAGSAMEGATAERLNALVVFLEEWRAKVQP